MSRLHLRRAALGVLSLAVAGTALAIAPAAQAAPARLAGCHWVVGDKLNTFDCGRLDDAVDKVSLVDCWKYPPSQDVYVVRKTASGWVKGGLGLRTREGGGCPSAHPWRTVVTVPTTGMKPMRTSFVRLVMPASSGVYAGKPYSFTQTSITYGVCIVREGATQPCGG